MPKKTRTKKTTSPPIPPLAQAVALSADPQAVTLREEFVTAWAQMPALLETIRDGESGRLGRTDRHAIVTALLEREYASLKAEAAPTLSRFVEALDLMEDHDADMRADVVTPITDFAFFTGVAYAVYVLTNGGAR